MKPLIITVLSVFLMYALCGCGEMYPYIEVRSNCWNYSAYNREIQIGSQYAMNQSHPYDLVETEQCVDVIIHFSAVGQEDAND